MNAKTVEKYTALLAKMENFHGSFKSSCRNMQVCIGSYRLVGCCKNYPRRCRSIGRASRTKPNTCPVVFWSSLVSSVVRHAAMALARLRVDANDERPHVHILVFLISVNPSSGPFETASHGSKAHHSLPSQHPISTRIKVLQSLLAVVTAIEDLILIYTLMQFDFPVLFPSRRL